MMKKALFIMLCVAALALTGCGQKNTPDTTVNAAAAAAPTQTVQSMQTENPTGEPVPESSAAEIDLT